MATLEQIREKFTWETFEGEVITITQFEDEHLANCINHVKNANRVSSVFGYPNWVLPLFEDEAKRRKLGSEFLDAAPYPFIDNTGKKRSGNYLGKP